MTKCQHLKEFSDLVLPETTKNEQKYLNWSYSTVGTVQILKFFNKKLLRADP